MTPEERDLVADLFTRLAELEREPRDPEAERLIRDGLRRAPNAVYALVQTVLVQDEALKAANAHIADLEDKVAQAEAAGREQPRSFLGERRGEAKWNTGEVIRGSVPQVRPPDQPWGAAPGGGGDRGGDRGGGGYPPGAQMQGGAPMSGGPMGGGGGGGFLGTAAAVAAGAIGGSLLMGGIRSALGGHGGGGPASGALNKLSGDQSGGGANELSRDAGLNDIGKSRQAAADTQNQPTDDEQQDFEQDLEDDTLDGEDIDAGDDEE